MSPARMEQAVKRHMNIWLALVTAAGCAPPADDETESTNASTTVPGETSADDDGGSSGPGDDDGSTGAGEETDGGATDDGPADDTGGDDTGGADWPDELPINCTAMPDAPECARPIWIDPGTIGSGPHLSHGGFPELGAGFLDAANERVVVSAKFGSDSVLPTGAIATIDLRTGERVIVSGRWYDDYVGASGLNEVGTGAPIDYYFDVKPGADGWYAVGQRVMDGGASKYATVVHIDPATGDREVVWDEIDHPCDDGAGQAITPNPDSIAIAPDGRVLLNFGQDPLGAGYGIAAVSTTGCVVVSRSGGANPDVGGGDAITDDFRGMDVGNGLVWGVDWLSETLTTIDPATGERTRISSTGGSMIGTGPELANQALAFGGDVVYTYAGWLTEVDPATGNRTEVTMGDGPLSFADEDGKVIPHANPKWVVVLSEVAVTVLDKQTGNNNILSY